MRTLTGPTTAAVNAIITSPGHLVELVFPTTPPTFARWSDIGQVTIGDNTFAAVDMKLSKIASVGDGPPQGIGIQLSNLDSVVGGLLLANDLTTVPVYVYGFDRAAINVADVILFGRFQVTGAQIGIDTAALSCAPAFYTAPFRRVDVPNGFRFAMVAGTSITWGRELTIYEQSRPWENYSPYHYAGRG